jgi:hypothetical protein
MDVTNINLRINVLDRIFIGNFTNPSPNTQYAAVYRLTLGETCSKRNQRDAVQQVFYCT